MLGPLLLLLCAILWGSAFVAQKCGADHLGPFAVLFVRSILAAVFLWFWARLARGSGFTRRAWWGGAVSGVALFTASLAQQFGIMHTTPGICAFLTSNYMLLVPIFGLLLGRRVTWPAWMGVAVALLGSYFICIDPSAPTFSVGLGECMTLLCAVLFAMQILFVDRFAPNTDAIAFSCVQQIACVVCSLPFLLLASERIHYTEVNMMRAAFPLLYLGIISSGVAYTLQILGQVRTAPTPAVIIMSLESVFGALAGYVFFGDVLTTRQLAGCACVFCAAAFTPILSAYVDRT